MKIVIGLIVTALILLAESSIWKVTYQGNVMYVGGTVHALRQSDYPLPVEFDKAFNQSELLVLETDMRMVNKPKYKKQMMQHLAYPIGRTLKDELNPLTYNKLQNYLRMRNLPPNRFDQFKPPMVLLSLTYFELEKAGIHATGVDSYFASKAQRAGMKIDWFESPDEQIMFLSRLGQGDSDALIVQAIENAKGAQVTVAQMITAWRKGDLKALLGIVQKEFKEAPHVYDELIVKRNRNWMKKLGQMMKSEETELVLVGALHLGGQNGILYGLRKLGCRIERVR